MRISCEVLVCRRQQSSSICKGHSCHASLSIGRGSGGSADTSNIFVYLCPAKTKKYTKYKVAGNIEKVLTRLVSEGKFIIYFKVPEENVYVKTDDSFLAKNFMKTLKAVLANRDLDKLQVFTPESVDPPHPKQHQTELTITTEEDYANTHCFPHSLRRLKIRRVKVSQIDPRILDLPHLRTLHMGMSLLDTLPPDLGKMAALKHLELDHNKLVNIPPEVFTGTLTNTLTTLDLSHNCLKSLPNTLTRLLKLESLILTGNKLVSLPLNLGKLTTLRTLKVEENGLMDLPISTSRLKLKLLIEIGNPLKRPLGIVEDRLASAMGPPPLKELAAHVCIKGRREELSHLPATLQRYLLDHHLCLCGRPCFESYILACVPLRLQTQMTVEGARTIPNVVYEDEICLITYVVSALGTFCSRRCWKKAANRKTRPSMMLIPDDEIEIEWIG